MIRKSIGILILSPFFNPNIGGVETHLNDLCEYLRKRHRVFVITYQPLTTRAKGRCVEKKKNLEIYRIPWFGYNLFNRLEPYPILEFFYLIPGLIFYSLFFMLNNNKKIDVIHAHGLNAGFVAILLNKLFNKRIVLSTHAIYNENIVKQIKSFINIILNRFDKILTLSDHSTQQLIKLGVDKRKIKRYIYWINQNVFKPYNKKKARVELGLNYNKIALFVGRLIEIKGVKLLVEIAKKLKHIHFVFIGSGPLETYLKRYEKEYRNIHFIGEIKNFKLSKYYSAADVLVVPSLYDEGFGRVILEAMSCGTPVIASNRGGIKEYVNPSVGMLINTNPKTIEKEIRNVFKNLIILKKWSKNCVIYARKNFSMDNAKIIGDVLAE